MAPRLVVLGGRYRTRPPTLITRRQIQVLCPRCSEPLYLMRHTGMSVTCGITFDAVCEHCLDAQGCAGKRWPRLTWHPIAWEASRGAIADVFPLPARRADVTVPRCGECGERIAQVAEFFWHPALSGPLHRACLAVVAPQLVAKAQAGELPWAVVEELGAAC